MRRLNLVNWYGGKGGMLAKLLPLIPAGGQPYCEPYAGGASVLLNRKPASCEVLNDFNEDLVGLFRVLQDRQKYEVLQHRLRYTLYSLSEFKKARRILNGVIDGDEIDRAWAFFVAHNQSVSGVFMSDGNWSRTFTSTSGMARTASKWIKKVSNLDRIADRLRMVQIDCRDAIDVIRYWDNTNAVFYVDPPYVLSTRKNRAAYKHEATDEHHVKLVETLLSCQGAVVLSGYDHAIYAQLDETGWHRVEFDVACHAASRNRNSGLQGDGAALKKVPRTEVVWRNPRAIEMLRGKTLLLDVACQES